MLRKSLYILILTGFVFQSCQVESFPEINFPVPEKVIKAGMDSLFTKNPEFKMPQKWQDQDDWAQRGLGFLDGKMFYFSSNPEEMYYVTFSHYDGEDTKSCTIGIFAVSQGYRWDKYKELNKSERQRTEARFEKEIILRLKTYTHTQPVKTQY